MKFRWLSTLIALTILTSLQIVPSRADVVKDFMAPAQYILTKCKTATELDCIESVGLVNQDNLYNEGALVSESVNQTPRIQNGNAIYSGSTVWKIGNELVTLVGTLDSPVTKGCFSTCAALRFNVGVNNPLQTKVRFAFRTSWLRPMNVQMKALESDYTYKKILGGAHWTMEGKGTTYSTYWASTNEELNLKKNSNAKADFDGTLFDFYIHHAGSTQQESYWDPRCSDRGFSVQSHNTNETGDPIWDSVNETLFFSIFAPHFKMNGDLNTGYFKYWTSHEFMDCKYPNNTLTKSPKLIIEILNEDGTQNVATTAVTNKDGILYFYASGFHFSSPRILIKADKNSLAAISTPSPNPSVSPSPRASASPAPIATPSVETKAVAAIKSTTITCIKGKLTKKVTGTSPKCPTGYKKK